MRAARRWRGTQPQSRIADMIRGYYAGIVPDSLLATAYRESGDECAWRRGDAISVIECLSRKLIAVVGIEIWLATTPGPTIPTPTIYTWDSEDYEGGESWDKYVASVNHAALQYVQGFAWDREDSRHFGHEPYFNLTCTDRDEAETL